MLVAITFDSLGLTDPAPLSIVALVVNLLLGAACAYLLSWHYVRFGKTNSNRAELAQVFPIIVMTTVLIISVVKSSLALSLGLVGALSIVRFRTPIKEPEELGYLFISISLGLGLGADQRNPTLLALAIILFILATARRIPGTPRAAKHMLYCNIELPIDNSSVYKPVTGAYAAQLSTGVSAASNQLASGQSANGQLVNGQLGHAQFKLPADHLPAPPHQRGSAQLATQLDTDTTAFETINQILAAHTQLVDMRRLDVRDGFMHSTYLINCQDHDSLMALLASFQQQLPKASVSFVDQKGPLGI